MQYLAFPCTIASQYALLRVSGSPHEKSNTEGGCQLLGMREAASAAEPLSQARRCLKLQNLPGNKPMTATANRSSRSSAPFATLQATCHDRLSIQCTCEGFEALPYNHSKQRWQKPLLQATPKIAHFSPIFSPRVLGRAQSQNLK